MADSVKYLYGTEEQILALTPEDSTWYDKAFYYPTDKNYFYQAFNGGMKKYCEAETVSGVGITLNDQVIGGVKNKIELTDILKIPENYEYNLLSLLIEGVINCQGSINILN